MIWHNWNVILFFLIGEPLLFGETTWTSIGPWAFRSFPRAAASSWNECKSRFLLWWNVRIVDTSWWDAGSQRDPLDKKRSRFAHFASTCNMFILWFWLRRFWNVSFGMYLLECIFLLYQFPDSGLSKQNNASWSTFAVLWTYVPYCALNLHSWFSFSGCSHLWAAETAVSPQFRGESSTVQQTRVETREPLEVQQIQLGNGNPCGAVGEVELIHVQNKFKYSAMASWKQTMLFGWYSESQLDFCFARNTLRLLFHTAPIRDYEEDFSMAVVCLSAGCGWMFAPPISGDWIIFGRNPPKVCEEIYFGIFKVQCSWANVGYTRKIGM